MPVLATDTSRRVIIVNRNTEPIQVGDKIRLATWNCGGISFTQRELCIVLGYDILL